MEVPYEFSKSLGHGEISCLAYAYKNRIAILTDENKARNIAKKITVYDQTSAQLVGWLVYENIVTDSDFEQIVKEHNTFRKESSIEKYLRIAQELALMAKCY